MPTPTPSVPGPTAVGDRGPLRIRMVSSAESGLLDGGWWPRSRDLAVEVSDLVADFPARLGTVTHVRYPARDWDGPAPRVRVADGHVTTEPFPAGVSHRVDLTTSEGTTLLVLVVPPGFSDADGAEALLAAATPRNAHSAHDLLEAITDQEDVDPHGLWRDGGDAWWGEDAVAPSFRP